MESSDTRYMTQDSDEVHDILCEQCDQHGIVAEAEGFCVDCIEYMCKMCLVYHKRYMPAHTLQDAKSMPQDCNVTEKCSAHSKLLIKYFCQTCQKLACSECKINEHKDCGCFSHISVLVSSDKNKEDIENIEVQIKDISEDLQGIREKLILNKEQIPLQETNAKHAMKVHGEKMVNILKDMKREIINDYDAEILALEETLMELRQNKKEAFDCYDAKQILLENNLKHAEIDMAKKMQRAKSTDESRLNGIEQQNTDIADCLGNLTSKLEKIQKSGQRCNTFIAVQSTQQILEKIEEELKEMKTGNKTCDYTVEPVADSFTFESVDFTKDFFSYKEAKKPIQKQVAVFDSKLQIQPVNYTSLCLLNESKLLVADHKSSAIFAFEDLQQNKLLSVLKMPAAPWGLAKVNDEKVVVTFPELGIVQFLTLSGGMSVMQTSDVKVGYDCYGVAYGRDRLIVSYLDPAKVQILDVSGSILRCFDNSLDHMPLFSSPRHIMLSSNKRLIYVSDSNKDTVTSMTFTGKVKAIYKDDLLVGPFQLTTDMEGSVYVCGRGSNNIHQLSSDLKKKKILLNEKHGLIKPVSVGLCEEENKLYIGMYSTNSIEVFNVEQE